MAKHRISLVDDNAGNADLASEAESQLRGHSQGTEAPTVLQYLFNALAALREHAQPVIDAHGTQPPLKLEGPHPVPLDTEATRLLATLLEQRNLSGVAHFNELADALRSTLGTEPFERMQRAIEDLDFALAEPPSRDIALRKGRA